MDDYELYHSGVKGMKWGVRRYQNKDGSLTPAGRKRYGYGQRAIKGANKVVSNATKRFKSAVDRHKAKKIAEKEAAEREAEETKKKNRPIRDLSDAELREKINRLNLERQALDLERQVSNLDPKRASSGESFIKSIGSKVVTPALMDAGKRIATEFFSKKGRELLGLSDDVDSSKALKKTVDELNLKKQKNELDKYFEREERKKAEAESKGADNKQTGNKQSSNNQQANKQSGNNSSGKKEKVYEGEVVGEGNSRRGSKKATNNDDEIIIEDDTVLPAIRNTKKYERGKKWINEMFDY